MTQLHGRKRRDAKARKRQARRDRNPDPPRTVHPASGLKIDARPETHRREIDRKRTGK